MTFKEIQELVRLINKSSLTEFKMKNGEFELSIRTNKYEKLKRQQQQAASQGQAPAQQAPIIQMPPVPPSYPAPSSSPSSSPQPKAPPEKGAEGAGADTTEDNGKYTEVRSPIVGTFYRSSSPEKPPYVKVGDVIEEGQVVCIVEAMKLFNEIESEISGKIVKVVVEDAQPVEYDQVLFLVEPA